MIVAVVGGDPAPEVALQQAEAVGREIALTGATLVCGGLGGIMEASCRGAQSAGGQTIGILPGTDRNAANPFVTLPIVTGLGHARNLVIVHTADAVIAIDGSYGTLSEIAFALTLRKPVVGLSTWTMSPDGGADLPPIQRTEDPKEAVRLAIAAVQTSSPA